jgi:hypothetical protein
MASTFGAPPKPQLGLAQKLVLVPGILGTRERCRFLFAGSFSLTTDQFQPLFWRFAVPRLGEVLVRLSTRSMCTITY